MKKKTKNLVGVSNGGRFPAGVSEGLAAGISGSASIGAGNPDRYSYETLIRENNPSIFLDNDGKPAGNVAPRNFRSQSPYNPVTGYKRDLNFDRSDEGGGVRNIDRVLYGRSGQGLTEQEQGLIASRNEGYVRNQAAIANRSRSGSPIDNHRERMAAMNTLDARLFNSAVPPGKRQEFYANPAGVVGRGLSSPGGGGGALQPLSLASINSQFGSGQNLNSARVPILPHLSPTVGNFDKRYNNFEDVLESFFNFFHNY